MNAGYMQSRYLQHDCCDLSCVSMAKSEPVLQLFQVQGREADGAPEAVQHTYQHPPPHPCV